MQRAGVFGHIHDDNLYTGDLPFNPKRECVPFKRVDSMGALLKSILNVNVSGMCVCVCVCVCACVCACFASLSMLHSSAQVKRAKTFGSS